CRERHGHHEQGRGAEQFREAADRDPAGGEAARAQHRPQEMDDGGGAGNRHRQRQGPERARSTPLPGGGELRRRDDRGRSRRAHQFKPASAMSSNAGSSVSAVSVREMSSVGSWSKGSWPSGSPTPSTSGYSNSV